MKLRYGSRCQPLMLAFFQGFSLRCASAVALAFTLWCGLGLAVIPAAEFDLPGFIDQQVKAGEKRIVVPPGRYRVTPKNGIHLVLRDLKDIQIICDNVEMVCTETTRAIAISNCTNLTIRGLTIDYDPLPFTQGRIVALSADKKIHEIELFTGYPEAASAENSKYEIFDAQTRELATDDHYPQKIEVIDRMRLRVVNAQGSAKDPEKVGDLIVIGANNTARRPVAHAIVCEGNVNMQLEDITLYASNCFGFFEHDCDGSTYLRCRIGRRAPDSDPIKRADPRLRSLNADAFHCKDAVKGPAYIECVASHMGDDAVNICGDYHVVVASRGNELRVLAKRTMNIAVDDPVELVAYDGTRLPDAKALTIEAAGKITEDERAFLLKQHMDDHTQQKLCVNAYKITLDRAVELPMGSLIASGRRMGNGFEVRGCEFGYNRSRGILIKGSNGSVSGNKLSGNWGYAILVAPEYWWLESGSASKVIISDNVISNCRTRPILVKATGGNGRVAPSGAHRMIAILRNTISNCKAPFIEVTSTEGLRLEDNVFSPVTFTDPAPAPIKLENCTQVTERGNVIKPK